MATGQFQEEHAAFHEPGRGRSAVGPRPRRPDRGRGPRLKAAFSLLELLLAVSIMGVLITALYSMFFHTQRAMLANVNQVDVTETGRATMDLLSRSLAEMSPTLLGEAVNFRAALTDGYTQVVQDLAPSEDGVSGLERVNVLQEMFFVTRRNQEYVGTLYRILFGFNGVGTLSTFSTNIHVRSLDATNLISVVLNQPFTNYTYVADGVIHFKIDVYDAHGIALRWGDERYEPNVRLTRESRAPELTRSRFLSNALPAYVEVELGVLEPETYEQYKTFEPGSDFARTFLATHAGQVQLFRQRIPVRESEAFYAEYP